MVSVVILGSGNVAQHLIRSFSKAESVRLVQVYARNPAELSKVFLPEKITADITQITNADLYIIAVSDDAIAQVCHALPFSGKLVVHTSGTRPQDVIPPRFRRGVFYPLQTFSKSRSVDYKSIPFCLEADHEDDYLILEKAAAAISSNSYRMDSNQRKALHVAAVFVNNFSNHMYRIGQHICEQHHIPFDILKPLITETAQKVMTLSPSQAQTGPAIRHDQTTLAAHLAFLQDTPYRELYEKLTQSIQYE